MDKTNKSPIIDPHSDAMCPHAHLHHLLLPCNELHDHRQTHKDMVSSNKMNKCNIT